MKVLVLGATGYIGGVVAERLAERGHEVVAQVRQAGREVSGVDEVRVGDLASAAALVTPDIDAVVDAAQLTGDESADLAAYRALAATGKPVYYTSGVWVLGRTDEGHEGAQVDPIALVGYKPKVEDVVLAGGGSVIRPGVVHGRGQGLAALLVGQAAQRGVGVYVEGEYDRPTWTFVHVDDLADLIVAAVEQRASGEIFHAVSEEAVEVADVATAAARTAGVKEAAEPWRVEEAAELLGRPFAEALSLSQRVSSARTRERLGWAPNRPGILEEVTAGSYAEK